MRANPLNTTSARTWSGWKQGRSAPRWLCRGVIGTGNMGRGIATRALAGNHSVTLLGTETTKAEALAAELSGDVRAGQVGDPLAGDVVVLAVWYGAVDDILNRYGDQLNGKVVDIANPIDVDAFEPLRLEAGSAAQEIAARAPGAKVVKAFNTTFAGTLGDGRVAGLPPRRPDRFRRRRRKGGRQPDRHRRRPAPDRRRPAPARQRARGAWLPPHGGAAAARHGLLQRGEDSRLARHGPAPITRADASARSQASVAAVRRVTFPMSGRLEVVWHGVARAASTRRGPRPRGQGPTEASFAGASADKAGHAPTGASNGGDQRRRVGLSGGRWVIRRSPGRATSP